MMREITRYGQPILKKVVVPVGEITPDLVALTDEMLEIMRKNRGVGLAANQIALDLAVAVVQYEGTTLKMFNPRIVTKTGTQRYEEGCLSIPGVHGEVTRAETVTVRYRNVEGADVEEIHREHVARIIQHEVDHLNGILIINHFSVSAKALNKKLLERIREESLARPRSSTR